MGTAVGNIIALIFIFVSALVGFVSLAASSITFIVIAYIICIIIMLLNFLSRPAKNSTLSLYLHPQEFLVYQHYHLHFLAPGAAEIYSALLNGLRMAGFVWGALCLWNGLYWLGGISIAYGFITSGLIAKLNPLLYIGNAAKKGNKFAIEQISLIESVREKREMFYSRKP